MKSINKKCLPAAYGEKQLMMHSFNKHIENISRIDFQQQCYKKDLYIFYDEAFGFGAVAQIRAN